jgi:hypothetical protein
VKTLKELYRKWKKIGKRIANIQIRVIFTVFYVIVIVPFGWAVKLIAPRQKNAGWHDAARDDTSIASARRLY